MAISLQIAETTFGSYLADQQAKAVESDRFNLQSLLAYLELEKHMHSCGKSMTVSGNCFVVPRLASTSDD